MGGIGFFRCSCQTRNSSLNFEPSRRAIPGTVLQPHIQLHVNQKKSQTVVRYDDPHPIVSSFDLL